MSAPKKTFLQSFLFTAGFIVFTLIASLHPVHAATLQLTNNTVEDTEYDVDSGNVVWTQFDGNDYEVYLYKSSDGTTSQITDNTISETYLKIDGNYLVWVGCTAVPCSSNEIVVYNITTGTTTQITHNTYDDTAPEINDGYIGWIGQTNSEYDVFLYNIATSTTTQASSTGRVSPPDIDNNLAVWSYNDGNDYEISLYNITTGVVQQLTDNETHEQNAQIGDGKIVWVSDAGATAQIVLYDLETNIAQQVTNTNVFNTRPDYDNGKVVWATLETPTTYNYYMFDTVNGTTTKLNNETYIASKNKKVGKITIEENSIVWNGSTGGNYNIYHYNISSGVETQLTDGFMDSTFPRMKGGKVAWSAYDGNDYEIFLSDGTGDGSNQAPELSPIGNKTVNEGQLLQFAVSATDPDGHAVMISAQNIPTGATFNSQSRIFSWTPTASQSGNYEVTFIASDNGMPAETDSEKISITVVNVPTLLEQVHHLITVVKALPISNKIEKSYVKDLEKVAEFIEDGKINKAIKELNAFMKEVKKDYEKRDISILVYTTITTLAQNILNNLQ